MKKICLLFICFLAMNAQGQILWDSTYYGNGKTGSGGTVGEGSLQIQFRNDSVIITFTKGAADFNDVVVVYLQSGALAGGFSSTANFTDFSDPLRAAISGFDGTNRSVLNFANGFTPNQVFAFNSDSAGMYGLAANGPHEFWQGMNLQPIGDKKSPTYRLAIPYNSEESEGPSNDEPFYFLVTYVNSSCYRSNEFIGDAGPQNNPGWTDYNSTTFNSGVSPGVPVTLMSFNAINKNNFINLQWKTAQESNISGYEILRGADGKNFSKISWVSARNLEVEQLYFFEDTNPLSGNNFYKLGIIGMDGKVEYSKIVNVKMAATADFKVYMNSSNRILNLDWKGANAQPTVLEITNATGQKIYQSSFVSSQTTYTFDLKKSLKPGVYAVSIIQGGEKLSKMILVK